MEKKNFSCFNQVCVKDDKLKEKIKVGTVYICERHIKNQVFNLYVIRIWKFKGTGASSLVFLGFLGGLK